MFEKILVLSNRGKLTNYTWFFGCMVLGIAAISGMAWTHCGLASRTLACPASEGAKETCAAEKGADK